MRRVYLVAFYLSTILFFILSRINSGKTTVDIKQNELDIKIMNQTNYFWKSSDVELLLDPKHEY